LRAINRRDRASDDAAGALQGESDCDRRDNSRLIRERKNLELRSGNV